MPALERRKGEGERERGRRNETRERLVAFHLVVGRKRERGSESLIFFSLSESLSPSKLSHFPIGSFFGFLPRRPPPPYQNAGPRSSPRALGHRVGAPCGPPQGRAPARRQAVGLDCDCIGSSASEEGLDACPVQARPRRSRPRPGARALHGAARRGGFRACHSPAVQVVRCRAKRERVAMSDSWEFASIFFWRARSFDKANARLIPTRE